MNVSQNALDALRVHWAIEKVGNDALDRADRLIDERRALRAAGNHIDFSFSQDPEDDAFLERIALVYELAATEGLDELSRPSGENLKLQAQSAAASYKAFEIRSLMPIPHDPNDRMMFILKISAMAYCGDRWSDLRRWYDENSAEITVPDIEDATWRQCLLYGIFDCWIRLFRKNGWEDMNQISRIIARLQEDQESLEAAEFSENNHDSHRFIAIHLLALYHWAEATEVLARYMLDGQTTSPFSKLDKHFDAALQATAASGDIRHELVLRWLHAAARAMVSNSLWWTTRTVNSRTTDFVRSLVRRDHQAMFELLPPQRAALAGKGLLDQAKTAIVIDMPTSGGKTLLAQFRILQALNQFNEEKGWVAYIAPTRALVAQMTRRLRKDFDPVNVRVEQLTAAMELDSFEEDLLASDRHPFHILVSTPEKLSLVIRNDKISRPLSLLVMDEAQNIESAERGLRIELLLATVKHDCPRANFLLLMPFVDHVESVAKWLAQDASAGQAISLGTVPWKPNERIVGIYRAIEDKSEHAGWRMELEALTNTPKAIRLSGKHLVGGVRPINVPKSEVISKGVQKGFSIQTAAISALMSDRGTSIAVGNSRKVAWGMATKASERLPAYSATDVPEDIQLVQNFLRSEISDTYKLVGLLNHGVGVHHAGLSDETRSLMEWLAEKGSLKLLCATTTIAQGLNFPVSSVFLQTYKYSYGKAMTPRDFWNLAGRAGRVGHDSIGIVGLAEGSDRATLTSFVGQNTGALVSRLVTLLDELDAQGKLSNLEHFLWQDQWEDFRCYVAHLWAEKKNLNAVLANTELLLRQTYGFNTLRNDPAHSAKASALLSATKSYARQLADAPRYAELANSIGFSPEGVRKAIFGMRELKPSLQLSDLAPDGIFGTGGKLADLFGVMLNVRQLRPYLEEISGEGSTRTRLSNITRDWVNGKSIESIAHNYFSCQQNGEDNTDAITKACSAIYRSISNSGTWGISALCQVSGLDFDSLSEVERRAINTIPAMIYHGVRTEDAVLMRMNSVPRGAAESLGELYKIEMNNESSRLSVSEARNFLKSLSSQQWDSARPLGSALSGEGYRSIWQVLSGESL